MDLTYCEVGKILLDISHADPGPKHPMIRAPRIGEKPPGLVERAEEHSAFREKSRLHNVRITAIIQERLKGNFDPRTGKEWDISLFAGYDPLPPEAKRYRALCDGYNALHRWNGACAIEE